LQSVASGRLAWRADEILCKAFYVRELFGAGWHGRVDQQFASGVPCHGWRSGG
jgi:hypothetical protein